MAGARGPACAGLGTQPSLISQATRRSSCATRAYPFAATRSCTTGVSAISGVGSGTIWSGRFGVRR